jgi:hypothetical protein
LHAAPHLFFWIFSDENSRKYILFPTLYINDGVPIFYIDKIDYILDLSSPNNILFNNWHSWFWKKKISIGCISVYNFLDLCWIKYPNFSSWLWFFTWAKVTFQIFVVKTFSLLQFSRYFDVSFGWFLNL